jgi:hypothetical protein
LFGPKNSIYSVYLFSPKYHNFLQAAWGFVVFRENKCFTRILQCEFWRNPTCERRDFVSADAHCRFSGWGFGVQVAVNHSILRHFRAGHGKCFWWGGQLTSWMRTL